MPLDCKYQLQVSGLISVIQESIVADLLETEWQHMHQVTPDEFHIVQGNRPARLVRFSSPGRKRDPLSIHRQDAAV